MRCICMRGVPDGLGESMIVCVIGVSVACMICMYICVYDIYTYICGIPVNLLCLWESALVSLIDEIFIKIS